MSENKIIAERNGAQRPFSIEMWNNLPKDKYGWKLIDGEALPEVNDVKKDTKTSYTPPEVKEIQAKQEVAADVDNNGPDAVKEDNPNADTNNQANADSNAQDNGGDGNETKEKTTEQARFEWVKRLVAEGKDRKAVAAELGIHWQQSQKLIDQVNSQANADTKE